MKCVFDVCVVVFCVVFREERRALYFSRDVVCVYYVVLCFVVCVCDVLILCVLFVCVVVFVVCVVVFVC